MQDVKARTAYAYDRAVEKFEVFLRLRGCRGGAAEAHGQGVLMQEVAAYLRFAFLQRSLSSSGAGNLISALKRFVLIAGFLGVECGPRGVDFVPLWRLLRNWVRAIPLEFRCPVHLDAALALGVYFWVSGVPALTVFTILGFHCLLRPAECMNVTRKDIVLFSNDEVARYGIYGVVLIRRPKTAHMPMHGKVQFVTILDAGVAGLLRNAWAQGAFCRGVLWKGSYQQLLGSWKAAVCRLGLASAGLLPAGLRGGGATEALLTGLPLPELRRRGRWGSERTLEHYLQEATYCCLRARQVHGWGLVSALASLAPTLLSSAME